MYLISSIPGGHLALWVALIAVVCGTIPACQGPRNPKHADQSPANPPAQTAPPQGGAPAASAGSAEPRVEHDAVVLGNARFGLLGEGIVRLEFAPDGRFDDRPTFRAITMPAPLPFDKIQMVDGELVLTATGIELRYRPPEPSSMRITWQAGGIHGVWSPS